MKRGALVIVGDTLLDVDIEGTSERLAPDTPVPVVACDTETRRPGGAGLAAVLAAAGGLRTVIVTALGDDDEGRYLSGALRQHAEVVTLPLRGSTPCKARVRACGQAMLRLDRGDGRAEATQQPMPGVARALRAAGAVLVCDYGRGVTAQPWLRDMLAGLPREVPVIWDPHISGNRPVPATRLATPNQAEARQFAARLPAEAWADDRGRHGGISQAARDGDALAGAWGTAVAVTLGRRGALLAVGESAPFLVPAEEVAGGARDTCGAGDSFAVAAAATLHDGGMLTDAVSEAVRSASRFVAAGAASALGSGAGLAQPASATDPWQTVSRVRSRRGRVVATSGCFDLLHAGHVELLRQARTLGDCLVVCLNSDSSVRELKGDGRPLVAAADRARVLSALECVDAVVVFRQRTPVSVAERLRPDIWVKGGDYMHSELPEADVVRRHGGQVVFLPYHDRHSTTRIVAAACGVARGSGRDTGAP